MPYVIRDENTCNEIPSRYWYATRDKFTVGFVLDTCNATFFNTIDEAREFYNDYHDYFMKYGLSSPFNNYKPFMAQNPEICEVQFISVEALKCHT